ncbi:MAG: ROK family protein [Oscillospiraceae bacterium]
MKIIGLDCKSTGIRGVVCDQNGNILNAVRMATDVKSGVLQYIGKIQSLLNTLAQSYNHIDGVGVATAGYVDTKNRLVLSATDFMPGYAGTDLNAVVRTVLKTKVCAENVTRAALIGERWIGSAKKYNNAVMLTLDINVGENTVFDGCIYKSKNRFSGEWRAVEPMMGDDENFYQYISDKTMSEQMEIALRSEKSITEFLQICCDKNPHLYEMMQKFSHQLVSEIGNIQLSDQPEAVIIGGDFAEWYDIFQPIIAVEMEKAQITLPIKKAELGANAGCVGAVKLYLNHVTDSYKSNRLECYKQR